MPNVNGTSGRTGFNGSAQGGGNSSGGRAGGGSSTSGSKLGDQAKKSQKAAPPPGFSHGGLGGSQKVGPSTPGGGHASDGPGGGTTTRYDYTPGAVPNYPDAQNPLRNLLEATAIGPLGPVSTATMLANGFAKALNGDDFSESPFTDTGPQGGWQPDRDRNMNGGPAGDDDDRTIMGKSYGAGTEALTSDNQDTPSGGSNNSGDDYSDVQLQDRRKPKIPNLGAGARMALALA
jgi:hypothetical protein